MGKLQRPSVRELAATACWFLGVFWGYAAIKNLLAGGDWTDILALVVSLLLWVAALVLWARNGKSKPGPVAEKGSANIE